MKIKVSQPVNWSIIEFDTKNYKDFHVSLYFENKDFAVILINRIYHHGKLKKVPYKYGICLQFHNSTFYIDSISQIHLTNFKRIDFVEKYQNIVNQLKKTHFKHLGY